MVVKFKISTLNDNVLWILFDFDVEAVILFLAVDFNGCKSWFFWQKTNFTKLNLQLFKKYKDYKQV